MFVPKANYTVIGQDFTNASLACLLAPRLSYRSIQILNDTCPSLDKIVSLLESSVHSIEGAFKDMFVTYLNSDINKLSGKMNDNFSTRNTNASISKYPFGDGRFLRVATKLLELIKEEEEKKASLDAPPHWTGRLDKFDVDLLQSLLKANHAALTSLGCA